MSDADEYMVGEEEYDLVCLNVYLIKALVFLTFVIVQVIATRG